jgi:hypothetical protein
LLADFISNGFTNTFPHALGNYIRQGLSGVITAIDYPEGGKGRIARLPDTNPPQVVAGFVSMGAAGDDNDETNLKKTKALRHV